ncbi:DUF4249 domain-containing protein [Larkinella humicola]|uniref:DUF4249 domain-containing protein n=1 Tax=Larkinella humicola TaxID=2607654 RepID=A0A5N1JBN7_9BACT|nr:DUF4249 domain-containing protein [Larkinella humicola]KAA9349825.1 DUF4249 domain-containing protein [Larkinella humicola]
MRSFSLFLLLALGLTACVETIQLDLRAVGNQLVIEGKLTDDSTGNEILITSAVDFLLKNEFPPVTNATVSVRDAATQQNEVLSQSSPGVYAIRKIRGIPGHQYALTVVVDGQTYTATTSMPEGVHFDSLTYEEVTRFNTETKMVAVYQDPAAVANYYRWTLSRNGLPAPDVFVRSDVFTNGNQVRQTILNSEEIHPGDTITVDMQCLPKSAFDYFNGLMKLQGNNINQGTSPTNPETNLSGGALGHFSAYTSQKRTVVIR